LNIFFPDARFEEGTAVPSKRSKLIKCIYDDKFHAYFDNDHDDDEFLYFHIETKIYPTIERGDIKDGSYHLEFESKEGYPPIEIYKVDPEGEKKGVYEVEGNEQSQSAKEVSIGANGKAGFLDRFNILARVRGESTDRRNITKRLKSYTEYRWTEKGSGRGTSAHWEFYQGGPLGIF